jgi:hypothetical protein
MVQVGVESEAWMMVVTNIEDDLGNDGGFPFSVNCGMRLP